MGWLITVLTRPLGLVAVGVLIAVLGAWWLKTGYDDVPPRETLNRVEGVLERVTRPPPERGDSSSSPPYVLRDQGRQRRNRAG